MPQPNDHLVTLKALALDRTQQPGKPFPSHRLTVAECKALALAAAEIELARKQGRK